MIARTAASAAAAAAAAAAAVLVTTLTACAGAPTARPTQAASVQPMPTATAGLPRVRLTAPPNVVHAEPSWAPAIVPGMFAAPGATPPQDDAAIARAKLWIVSATPPPGVTELSAAPAAGPADAATAPACDWLVRATRWWATDAANEGAAKAWLTAHPVSGLVPGGAMSGPGDVSSLLERPAQGGNDSLSFEFAPDAVRPRTVDIRVDVTVVPTGAGCASSG